MSKKFLFSLIGFWVSSIVMTWGALGVFAVMSYQGDVAGGAVAAAGTAVAGFLACGEFFSSRGSLAMLAAYVKR